MRDVRWIEGDAFALLVGVKMRLTLDGIVTHMSWPTTGLFLEFEPCVDVILEQTSLVVGEMPDFMDGDDLVPHFYSLFDFGRAPRTGELALTIGVVAEMRAL